MTDARLLTNAAVAALLGLSRGAFVKKRRALLTLGFPDYVAGFHRRTDAVALEDWLDRQSGLDPARDVAARGGGARLATGDRLHWRRELDRRARALAS